jgi:uncharacterized protein (TIGR02001 family)
VHSQSEKKRRSRENNETKHVGVRKRSLAGEWTMKETLKKMVVGSLAMVALTAGHVQAQSSMPEFEFEASVDVAAKYVWRGFLLTDDPVIQPGFTVSSGGFAFNIWGNIDTTDINEGDVDEDYRIQEVDYTLSYGFSPSDSVDMEVGIIRYDFPGTPFDSTTEVYASATWNVLLAPTLTVYYDIDESDGLYVNGSIGHTFELTEALGLSLGAGLGWGDEDNNDFYYGVSESGVADLMLSGSLDYAVNDNFSISFYLGYSEIIDSDLEDARADSDVFNGGINFTYSF